MACIVNGNQIALTGDVGDFWMDECFTSVDVMMALTSIDDSSDLTVTINSGGGDAYEGAAIHALFDRRAGRTNITSTASPLRPHP